MCFSVFTKLQRAACCAILDHSRELRDYGGEGTRSRRRMHQCGQKQQVTAIEKTSHDLSGFFSQQLHIYIVPPFECFDALRAVPGGR